MGRKKTDATRKDKRGEGLSRVARFIYVCLPSLSLNYSMQMCNLFSKLWNPDYSIKTVCHYPANHSVRIRTRPLYIHVIMTKQSRPFGRLRKSVGKLPRRRPLTIKEVYRHIQSQRCLDDFPGVFVCTLYCCLAFEILDAHICSFADQIANDIFSLESNGSM